MQAVFATETSGGSSGTLISGQVRGGGTGLSLHTPAARDTRTQDTQDTQDTEDTEDTEDREDMTTSEAAAGPSPATSKALQKSADTVAAAVFRGDTGEAAQLAEARAWASHRHNSPPRSLLRLAGGALEPWGDTNIVMPLRAGRGEAGQASVRR